MVIDLSMDEPEIVPDKISNPINRKVIIGILVMGLGIFITLNIISEDDAGMLAFIISVSISGLVAIAAFVVSIQNRTSFLSKAYFSLALGFTAYVIAEILYYTFELVFGIEPYPSIADIFFFLLYPFLLGHLLINVKFFNSEYTRFQKIWIPGIPILILILYVIMSLSVPDAELNFDFYYGLIFVGGASAVISFTILGALIFKEGVWGTVWLLLVFGLMLSTVADVWYYNLEIFGYYYDAHPVTVFWFIANLIIVYALYKHGKIM